MSKFYCVTTSTPYCGEHFTHYLRIEDGDSLEAHMDEIYDWVADDAAEWWDHQAEEDFDGDYDDYLGECSYDVEEISETEYLADCGKG